MTLALLDRSYAEFTLSTGTSSLSIPFPYLDSAELEVGVRVGDERPNRLSTGSNYSVSPGSAEAGAGTLTLNSSFPSGTVLSIRRLTEILQPTDLGDNQAEFELDRATLAAQDARAYLDNLREEMSAALGAVSQLIRPLNSVVSAIPVTSNWVAEFGADDEPNAGRFIPTESDDTARRLTGTPLLKSGDADAYIASIFDGGLAFSGTGAPNNTVWECSLEDGSGTVEIEVFETADTAIAVDLSDAEALANAIPASERTANKTIALRSGNFTLDGELSGHKMDTTDITGIGETRGATRNPVFVGGSLTFRPADGETVTLTGPLETNGARGVRYQGSIAGECGILR